MMKKYSTILDILQYYKSCTTGYITVIKLATIGPQCPKTFFLTCAPSEDSDQPAHSRSLIRIFAGRIWDIQGFKVCHVDQEDSDQTVWMRRLIWVFLGRTCTKIRFLTINCIHEIDKFRDIKTAPGNLLFSHRPWPARKDFMYVNSKSTLPWLFPTNT